MLQVSAGDVHCRDLCLGILFAFWVSPVFQFGPPAPPRGVSASPPRFDGVVRRVSVHASFFFFLVCAFTWADTPMSAFRHNTRQCGTLTTRSFSEQRPPLPNPPSLLLSRPSPPPIFFLRGFVLSSVRAQRRKRAQQGCHGPLPVLQLHGRASWRDTVHRPAVCVEPPRPQAFGATNLIDLKHFVRRLYASKYFGSSVCTVVHTWYSNLAHFPYK